ncbi:MAG: 16S rRNA processing protein RimM [Alphaproteobacteria bacterium]|nr:MAG: 16S rRNA processing protein RimM [Alphaproteobacteria bacterium]
MTDETSSDALVCLGVITGARGIKGAVRIKPFTASPDGVAAYGEVRTKDGKVFRLSQTKVSEKGVIAQLDGIKDRDAAEALKGVELYVTRAQLPEPDEEEYYYVDLIGLSVRLASGEVFGRVKAVQDYGAGPLLEVVPATPPKKGGRSLLYAFTRDVVPEVNLKEGYLTLVPPHEEEAEKEPSR